MYRAPASQSGAPGIVMLIVLIWAAIYLAGCTDLPTDPGFEEIQSTADLHQSAQDFIEGPVAPHGNHPVYFGGPAGRKFRGRAPVPGLDNLYLARLGKPTAQRSCLAACPTPTRSRVDDHEIRCHSTPKPAPCSLVR